MNEKAKSLGILLAFEVGALAFTTHVGGGFALGTQEVQYFVKFGKLGLYLPLISMALLSTVLYLAWEFQRLYGISDYKDFFEKFFGRFGRVFMVLYDIVFSCMVVLAAGAALAGMSLSLIHISEPTRLGMRSYAVFCLKKKQDTQTLRRRAALRRLARQQNQPTDSR